VSSLRKTAVAFLLIFSIGAQWPLLQSFAWLNMFVSFSSEGGIKEALDKTFDGKHPCKICKLVREGKESEKKSSPPDSLKKKLDPMLAQTLEIRIQPIPFPRHAHGDVQSASRAHAPLGQPPDFA
jgi:hypothetical protein